MLASDISTQERGDGSNNPAVAYPDADIVLVSSDQKRFYLHKSILSLSSPVFDGMFSTPQPEDGSRQQSRMPDPITLSEDGETIQALVAIIYPDKSGPSDPDLSLLRKTAAAAHKYEMDGVLQYLTQALQLALYQDKEPLRVFSIAFNHNMKELAVAAAYKYLQNPWSNVVHPETDDISGTVMHRLQICRRRREELFDQIIPFFSKYRELTELNEPAPWGPNGCVLCKRGEYRSKELPLWFVIYLMDAREAFLLRPKGSSVRSSDLFCKAINKAGELREGYCKCSVKAPGPLAVFMERLASLLDEKLQKIKFEMP